MASQKTSNIPKGDHVNVHKPQQGPGRHLSPGVHDPTTPYVPSNPLAWGPKGEWGPKKSAEALNYEAQYAATKSYYTQGGAASRDATGDLGARCLARVPRSLTRAAAPSRRLHQRPVHLGGARQAGGGHFPAQSAQHRAAAQGVEAHRANLLLRRARRHEAGRGCAKLVNCNRAARVRRPAPSLYRHLPEETWSPSSPSKQRARAALAPSLLPAGPSRTAVGAYPVLRMPAAMPLMLMSSALRSSALAPSWRRRRSVSTCAKLMTLM